MCDIFLTLNIALGEKIEGLVNKNFIFALLLL